MRHVLGRALPLHERAGDRLGPLGGIEVGGQHHRAGHDAIHPDPRIAFGELHRERTRQRGDRALARKIGGVVGIGPGDRPVAHGDDRATGLLPHHHGARLLGDEKRADAIDVEVRPEVVGGDVLQRRRIPDRGAGDHGVDPAEVVGHAMHQRPHRPLVAEIRRDGKAGEAAGLEVGDDFPRLGQRAMAVDRDGIAAGRERPHHHRAHPLRAAGDERHPARGGRDAGFEVERIVHGVRPARADCVRGIRRSAARCLPASRPR